MLTIVLKRNAEPTVIQLTQENIMRELSSINGSEMLLEDSWLEGIKRVRTPYVCLVEAECTLSANYLSSNFSLMKKTIKTAAGKGGGYTKLAMLASCLGVKRFDNRIYNYSLQMVPDDSLSYYQIRPELKKKSSSLYHVQVGFVPGAIIRMSALGTDADKLPWDSKNLIELSAAVSFYFWGSGRRVQVNPNTTYVSDEKQLDNPPYFKYDLPDTAANIFQKEGIS